LKETVRRAGEARVPIVQLSLGEVLTLDDVKIEVYRVRTPVLTDDYCRATPSAPLGCTQFGNATRVGVRINNSSVVLRVSDASRSILFTGDIAGNGAPVRRFYEVVGARYCPWPTAAELWKTIPRP
jgi:hypothetical protein